MELIFINTKIKKYTIPHMRDGMCGMFHTFLFNFNDDALFFHST